MTLLTASQDRESASGRVGSESAPAFQAAPPTVESLLLEDFVRLPDSLEIEVSRAYWEDRGLQSFIHREVPSDITNNGVRAHQVARVLFANCEEAERRGALADEVVVVEMGMGLGLFARLLMRSFRSLCQQSERNYFDRLRYYATDRSTRNLADVNRSGTLDEFARQVRVGSLDAMDPSGFKPSGGSIERLTGCAQAIFHNYLYDALPHSQLMRQGGCWYELHVQTRLQEAWRVDGIDAQSPGHFAERIRRRDREALAALARCYEWLAVERSFFPTNANDIPHFDVANRFAEDRLQPFVDASSSGSKSVRFWMPWGALDSCGHSLPLLRESGFMLFCDYGVTGLERVLDARHYQRYGAGVCIGLNFPLLDSALSDRDRMCGFDLTIPDGDAALPLHARLLTRPESCATRQAFQRSFPADVLASFDEPVLEARKLLDSGERREAFLCFAEALQRCDQNWSVAGEWVHCANKAGEPVPSVLKIARRGLDMNPSCSADLWNELGDTLLRDERYQEAEDAYRAAVRIDPRHARSYYNLARTYEARKDYAAALRAIGESLSHDQDGSHTDLLLQTQSELLTAQHRLNESMRRIIEGRYA